MGTGRHADLLSTSETKPCRSPLSSRTFDFCGRIELCVAFVNPTGQVADRPNFDPLRQFTRLVLGFPTGF